MINGFIFLWKKVEEWEWYRDLPTFKLFIHLLINAYYQDTNWRNIAIKRGQVVSSIENLAVNCGLSVKQTRRAIDNLISTGEIITKGTNKFTIITICKYESYQTQNAGSGQTKVTTKVTTNGTYINNIINKEDNKDSIIYTADENFDADKSATNKLQPKTIDERKNDFMKLVADNGVEKYGQEMCREFFDYWTESNPNGKKMRFEMQKVFDIKKRLATWNKNNFKNSRNGNTNNQISMQRIFEASEAMREYEQQLFGR